jgi:hypothetical protein
MKVLFILKLKLCFCLDEILSFSIEYMPVNFEAEGWKIPRGTLIWMSKKITQALITLSAPDCQ